MMLEVLSDGSIDLAFRSGTGLLNDETLRTAVLISLMTDRRASDDDALPDFPTPGDIRPDRRGWCGDALAEDSSLIGSRLWLLWREKQTEETRRRAVAYCREALQWLIDDGIASAVTVDASWPETGWLAVRIAIALVAGGQFAVSATLYRGG